MNPVAYFNASTASEALAQVAKGGRFIGGGTNLIDLMKAAVMQPPALIDINGLPNGGIITSAGGGLLLGGASAVRP